MPNRARPNSHTQGNRRSPAPLLEPSRKLQSNIGGNGVPQDEKSKGWDTSYEWKIILVLSLTFGLVGLDRFILPVLFPSFMGELGLTYRGPRQPRGHPRGVLGHLRLRDGLPVRPGRAPQGADPGGGDLLADVGLLGHGRRAGQPAADPRGDGAGRRAGRLDRRRGGGRSLAPQAARHEQRHLPVHDLAVRQCHRPDHRHPAAAGDRLAHGVPAGRHPGPDHGGGDVLPGARARHRRPWPMVARGARPSFTDSVQAPQRAAGDAHPDVRDGRGVRAGGDGARAT